jgi:hypothetical protein
MSSLDLADELEAKAAALRAVGRLEADLAEAKAAYTANPNGDTKAAKQAAMEAVREARSLTRPEGVSVGGDAFVDKEV